MTREQILDMLNQYIEAESAVMKGKSISLNGQTMTMADLADIQKGRREFDDMLRALDRPRRLFSLARFP